MLPVGFEPAFPERERLQTHALDGAAFGISVCKILCRRGSYKMATDM